MNMMCVCLHVHKSRRVKTRSCVLLNVFYAFFFFFATFVRKLFHTYVVNVLLEVSRIKTTAVFCWGRGCSSGCVSFIYANTGKLKETGPTFQH